MRGGRRVRPGGLVEVGDFWRSAPKPPPRAQDREGNEDHHQARSTHEASHPEVPMLARGHWYLDRERTSPRGMPASEPGSTLPAMSDEPKKTGATYQDLVDLPPLYVGEIVSGDLYASPRPATPHSIISSMLGMLLGPRFQLGEGGPGGWRFIDEPELHFGSDVLVPDLAAWHQERLPATALHDAWIEIPPDWVCEILSPSTAKLDLHRKLPLYARVGVSFAWVIDPPEKTVKVLEAHEGAWIQRATFSGNTVVRALPFDAIELDLGRVWPPDPASVSSRLRPPRRR